RPSAPVFLQLHDPGDEQILKSMECGHEHVERRSEGSSDEPDVLRPGDDRDNAGQSLAAPEIPATRGQQEVQAASVHGYREHSRQLWRYAQSRVSDSEIALRREGTLRTGRRHEERTIEKNPESAALVDRYPVAGAPS